MKTSKRIWAFLLLGVMLAGFVLSGCTPEAETTEPDPNAIALRDLPFVSLEDIREIDVYYGGAGEPIRTLDSAEKITEFCATFERLRFTKIDSASVISSVECPTDEYEEAFIHIGDKETYRIAVKYGDEKQKNFYITGDKRVYCMDMQLYIYVSSTETDYIDRILNN